MSALITLRCVTCLLLLRTAVLELQALGNEISGAQLPAFATDTIADLSFKHVSLEQALDTVRRHWDKAHPGEPFPVAIRHYQAFDPFKDDGIVFTLELKKVPYSEAVRILARMAGMLLVSDRGLWVIDACHTRDIEEHDIITRDHELTAAGSRALDAACPKDTRHALDYYGVELGEGTTIVNSPRASGSVLVVMAPRTQQEQIAGICVLLNNGFRITK